ncbi:MAG: hypothetical protein Q9169_006208 [Polycauliona sp. 2 TL-2023]
MVSRLSRFRRKPSDESRLPRFQRTTSQSTSTSPSPSPSDASVSISDDRRGSTSSLRPISRKSSEPFQKSSGIDPGPLGLHIVYTPASHRKADIVFLHGLGGASRRTWSKDENPELFWPLKFLPLEPDISLARILTFGYNANFRASGSISTSVLDFAKDLLFDLKYTKDDEGADLSIGSAYMQGQNDPKYESIIKAISAICFLATPHRGTNLADVLDRILRTAFMTNSKMYLSELARNSFTLQKLNEQFRHIAPRLDIVSFYETQSTAIGMKNTRVMILEKDSSVLGYPGETSKALNADHHNVCKYESPQDPNYISVRNALKSFVSKSVTAERSIEAPSADRRDSYDLKSLLAITELPDVDYIFFRDQWVPGTNNWILGDQVYIDWSNTQSTTSSVLWLTGGAATGKSVCSSFIINDLVERGVSCQYFFIRFGDQKKRTLSFLLRSLAYQIARSLPAFLQKVLQLDEEAMDLECADPRTLWERLFKAILFNLGADQPLYWVIDGLDEADEPRAIVKFLSDIPSSLMPLRILLVGRKTSDLVDAFAKVPPMLFTGSLSIEGHLEDLGRYVRQELTMAGSPTFIESTVHQVIQGAQNNFLWVRLAVAKLNSCHTQSDAELALQQLPVGMEALYDRMAASITTNSSPANTSLALDILQCVACSLRSLAVTELDQALIEDTSKMLDFQRSIVDLCGGFVHVDNGGYIVMVHQTAREYLLGNLHSGLRIEKAIGHKHLYLSCMRCIMSVGLRAKVKGGRKPVFLDYAARSWSTHLASSPKDTQVVDVLDKFLSGTWILTWIQILATDNKLRVLIQASKHLAKFSTKTKQAQTPQDERMPQILKHELIHSWSVDLIKLVGKFGRILDRDPESIYKLIPPFCPKSSAVYQQFGKSKDKSLIVSGLAAEDWDDSLARISFGPGTYSSSILAAGAQIAVLISSGSVVLYDASTFAEASTSPTRHGERIYRMVLNSAGTQLATYGYRTTKIWQTATGICKISIANLEARPRPLILLFTQDSSTLLIGMDDRHVRSLDLTQQSPSWVSVAELEEPELEGHFLNAANHMAISDNGKLVAIAYRGHPLSAWEIEGPEHIGHCWRTRDELARGEVIEAVWHPHELEVFGLYIEGVVFRWRPYDDEVEEIAAGASRLAISRDGHLFATGDVRGTVKVFKSSDLDLLYQLASEDNVLGIAFSPELHRFYDCRGSYGNVWEPNVLMRYAEQRDKGESSSETESFAQNSVASESSASRVDAITVVAGSPRGRLYGCGTEKGAVSLYDNQRGKLAEVHPSKNFLSIEKMSWSDDAKYLCFADTSRKVSIMSLTTESGGIDPQVETKAEIQMATNTSGPILQLLFDPNGSRLLVRSSSMLYIVSLDGFSITQEHELQTDNSKWILHPEDPMLLIGVGPNEIRIMNWDLEQQALFGIQPSFATTTLPKQLDSADIITIDKVLVTHDQKHLLVQSSLSAHSSKQKLLYLLDIGSLSISQRQPSGSARYDGCATLAPITIPPSLVRQVGRILSILSQDNLIFLSRDFSICSWKIPSHLKQSSSRSVAQSEDSTSIPPPLPPRPQDHVPNTHTEEKIKVLFSLPGDWISSEYLALCCIWGVERSFLCPRNGEVAVVRCAALA